jgi:hypothetical protein
MYFNEQVSQKFSKNDLDLADVKSDADFLIEISGIFSEK